MRRDGKDARDTGAVDDSLSMKIRADAADKRTIVIQMLVSLRMPCLRHPSRIHFKAGSVLPKRLAEEQNTTSATRICWEHED
jgi:hypothetical protein